VKNERIPYTKGDPTKQTKSVREAPRVLGLDPPHDSGRIDQGLQPVARRVDSIDLDGGLIAEAMKNGLSPLQIVAAIPLMLPSMFPYTVPTTTLSPPASSMTPRGRQ